MEIKIGNSVLAVLFNFNVELLFYLVTCVGISVQVACRNKPAVRGYWKGFFAAALFRNSF